MVGYGTDAFITGSAMSANAITVYDGARSYQEVTVIDSAPAQSFLDAYLWASWPKRCLRHPSDGITVRW